MSNSATPSIPESQAAEIWFRSLLYEDGAECPAPGAPDCFRDLGLDQVVAAIIIGRDEYRLDAFFHHILPTVEAVQYRQAVMRDLSGPALSGCLREFAGAMRVMRERLAVAEKLYDPLQRQRWFLHAVETYCAAVRALAADLAVQEMSSRGLTGCRAWVADYAASDGFLSLSTACDALTRRLAEIDYAILVRGGEFQVRRSAAERDYGAEITHFFAKFRQAAAGDHRVRLTEHRDMDHIEAKVLEFVARLFPEPFSALGGFVLEHGNYLHPVLARLDRELQFYLSYLEHMERLAPGGLGFCYPVVRDACKQVRSEAGFDLALAARLHGTTTPVVPNDFALDGRERILLVSGPNQGGKTTFARVFGQLHHLAGLGCPVPGRHAELFLCDRIYTHFERGENAADLRGKLQDDLVRIHAILERATPRSIVIMNEIFNSTTLADATFLARRVIERIVAKDLLCVCVSFLDELADASDTIVSMTSTILPGDAAARSFKVVRHDADGRAYAMSIAEKYRLTYDDLLRRVPLSADRTENVP